MFSSISGFGNHLFGAIVLVVCFGLASTRIRSRFTTTKETFVISVLLLIIGYQYYLLTKVSTYVPSSKFYIYDSTLARDNCIHSDKGGKRPNSGARNDYFNPCFCQYGIGKCYDKQTGEVLNSTYCPMDGSAVCKETFSNSSVIPLYLSDQRNCRGGQSSICSINEPCFPCEIEKIVEFGSERCRSCSTDNKGECNFVPNVGPYCYDKPNSRKIVPCSKCCTDPEPKVINGKCY